MPVLGAPETPDAVLVAVLCLWGDVELFARFVVEPHLKHEEDPESFDPSDVLDPAALMQFGFTLSTVRGLSSHYIKIY